jgi:probable HAF family extracellular repeat protein
MRSWVFLSALGLSCALLAGDPAIAQTYTVTDLGILPGQGFTEALGINNSGDVIAFSSTLLYGLPFGNPRYYFLYRDGKVFPFSSSSEPTVAVLGIARDRGENPKLRGDEDLVLTGYTGVSQNPPEAFLYKDGILRSLGFLPGGDDSVGFAVNASGEVAGTAYNGDQDQFPFLYKHGNMMVIGPSGGSASGINDQGDVSGTGPNGENATHAFVYHDGKGIDLGTLPGSVTSYSAAINNAMEVTGQSFSEDGSFDHAFLWSKGQMKDLGTLPNALESYGEGINAWGDVVGGTDIGAFLYTHGKMYNLNDMIPSNSGWTLSAGIAINDRGDIVGDGTVNGIGHGFLLTVDCKNTKNKNCDECKRGR